MPSDASFVEAHTTWTITPCSGPTRTKLRARAAASSAASTAAVDITFAPPTPTPSAKGKAPAPAHPVEDLVPTQRDDPTTTAGKDAEGTFTTVSHKRPNRKSAAKKRAQASNSRLPAPNTTAPAQLNVKLMSSVPARPAYKGKRFPEPPTWKEVPIIGWSHVATPTETADATRALCGHEPTAEDLKLLHIEWDGHPSDEEATAIQTIYFRYVVQYGFPLMTDATKFRLTKGLGPAEAQATLKCFEEDWVLVLA
ncbi:hypothetical protein EDB92DRAFT_2102992 [Lactarius akahatsu]|uniref:Uncharacterized protein n=1 Tax=Lactarius akahatsu TaxID=416441 RepID=A0AAD4LNI0_9AGAM|nr:hypothetical protein EDB92DRAFT_2102992 [Lactarius akahatsu]